VTVPSNICISAFVFSRAYYVGDVRVSCPLPSLGCSSLVF